MTKEELKNLSERSERYESAKLCNELKNLSERYKSAKLYNELLNSLGFALLVEDIEREREIVFKTILNNGFEANEEHDNLLAIRASYDLVCTVQNKAKLLDSYKSRLIQNGIDIPE